METIAKLYPPLDSRSALPAFYVPACFTSSLLPYLLPSHYPASLRVGISLSILLALAIYRPYYTLDDNCNDYNTVPSQLIWAVFVVDFNLLSPAEGHPPRWLGNRRGNKSPNDDGGVTYEDLSTFWQRLKWSIRLQPNPRGIGWDWEVKNIAPDPSASLPKWTFVRTRLVKAAYRLLFNHLPLIPLGICQYLLAATDPNTSPILAQALRTGIGWSAVTYVTQGMFYIHNLTAALTVALGLCSTWEWPPIIGSLKDAWSVRQMWSVVYHQILRRTVQPPGQRLARWLGLKKGSVASKYLQLYVAFGISCLIHECCIFVVTRRDVGEFWFFMSQPLAITFEDLVMWSFGRVFGEKVRRSKVVRIVGYLWTFAWFSYSLPLFVMPYLDHRILGHTGFEPQTTEQGRRLGRVLFG